MMNFQQSFKGVKTAGQLFLVPTPIGNLDDMTFRAVTILKTVDLIASEDTRNTQKLLNHFEITTSQESFHDHNSGLKLSKMIDLLKSGKSIAQVSDAGLPSISDPGHDLVLACIAQEIDVIALPGASAVPFSSEAKKIYEEYRRGHISEVLAPITEQPIKGESLIIVSGSVEE